MHRVNTTKPGILTTHRYWIMALSLVLFLPPLSFLFQFTGDSNFCGTWCPRMFFVWRKGASLDTYFMGYLRSFMGVALVFGILITTFLFGRYWCSHLCPIGNSMEFGSRFVPKFLKINFAKVPAAPLRYGYLTVYFAAAALGIGSLCCSYCNFAAIPRLFGAPFSGADLAFFLRTGGLINLGLVLLLGIFAKGGRAYCNLICPIGALDALANRIGIRWGRRFAVTSTKCNGCGQCVNHCPTWAIDVTNEIARIDPLSCMPCGVCETICARKAIEYRVPDADLAPKAKTIYEKI